MQVHHTLYLIVPILRFYFPLMSTIFPSTRKSTSRLTSSRLSRNSASHPPPLTISNASITPSRHMAVGPRVADFPGTYVHHSRTPPLSLCAFPVPSEFILTSPSVGRCGPTIFAFCFHDISVFSSFSDILTSTIYRFKYFLRIIASLKAQGPISQDCADRQGSDPMH